MLVIIFSCERSCHQLKSTCQLKRQTLFIAAGDNRGFLPSSVLESLKCLESLLKCVVGEALQLSGAEIMAFICESLHQWRSANTIFIKYITMWIAILFSMWEISNAKKNFQKKSLGWPWFSPWTCLCVSKCISGCVELCTVVLLNPGFNWLSVPSSCPIAGQDLVMSQQNP